MFSNETIRAEGKKDNKKYSNYEQSIFEGILADTA
jgi:hypothetical protein